MSRNNFKKPQFKLFKLQISPMGNFAWQQTCYHSETLLYYYVSGEKHFWPLLNVRDHIPLKYVTVHVNKCTDTFYAGSSPLKAKCVRYILPRFDTFHTYSIHFQTWNALNAISFQETQQPSCKCWCGVTFVSCTCVSIST